MPRLPLPAFVPRFAFYLRNRFQRLAMRSNPGISSATLCVIVALAFAVSLPAQQPLGVMQPNPHATRRAITPEVTGTDSSQTGTANFFGDFTSISAPAGALTVFHESDCTLSLATGTYTITPNFTYSETALANNYDRVLHAEAQLTSTPSVFSKGCLSKPTAGLGTRPGVYVGPTTSGVSVFAGTGPIYPSMVEGVYVLTYNMAVSLSSFQFSTVGGLNTADLNKDGNGDLVAVDNASASTARVSVFLGKADGTFQNAVTYAIAGNYSVAAVIDDVNGDGKLDIVAVSGDQQISVLLGNGDGTFQTAQSFAAPARPGYTTAASAPINNLITADLRGVGKKDLICSNGLVLLGNGNGTFTAASVAAFPYASDSAFSGGPNVASGDFNNDGKPDLAVDAGSGVSIWLGKGDGTFTQGLSYAAIDSDGFVSVDDLDGDGNADILVGLGDGGSYFGDISSPNQSYALMGKGDGTFQGAPQLASGAYNGNNLVDLNGDGAPDLIAAGSSGGLTVQLNNGKGSFTAASTIVAPASFVGTSSALTSPVTITNADKVVPTSYAVADVNGDGKADLVFVDNGLTALNAVTSQPFTFPTPIYFVALNKGDGTFNAPVPHSFPQIAASTGFDNSAVVSGLNIADFTHDGKNDLVFVYNETAGGAGVNYYNQGILVLPGVGDGTFGAPVLTSTYSSNSAPTTAFVPQILNVADLTGDNNPDLIVNLAGTTIINFQLQTQLETFVSNGNGTFKTPTTVAVGANTYATTLADFNKDGKTDLAVLAETSAGQAELVVLPGNSDGTFGSAAVSNLLGGDAIRSAGIAAADFDGDGNADIGLIEPNQYSGLFYGKGNLTFTSVPVSGGIVPKDLISVMAGAPAVAIDLNKDSKPDILAGGVSLLNITGSTPVLTAGTTTTLVTAQTPIVVGTSVKFTATVAPASGTGTPTGSVTFMDGTATLGTGTLAAGVASYTTSALTSGSHSITAVYGGDTNFSGSTSSAVTEVVNKATPTVSVTPAPTSINVAQGVAVTVTVTGTTGNSTPTGSVVLSGGGYTSAATTLVSGSATINIAAGALATGTDTLTANYTPDSSSSSTYNTASGSNTVTVTIAPSFGLSNGGNLNFAAGASTGNTSTITVTPSGGFTGTVNLSCAVTTIPTGAPTPATCGVTSSANVTSASAVTATLTVNTTSTTTIGAYAVTVTGTSGSITQTTVVGVTLTAYVPPPTFALTNSGAITVTKGATTGNTSTITVAPSGGFTGSVALSAALTASPAGASSLPTLSFGTTTPVSITGAGSGTATLTVTTTAATSAQMARPNLPWYAAGGATLAGLLLLGIPARRRRWRAALGMFLLLALAMCGIASCGGKPKTTGSSGTTAGSYTITVTGASGALSQTTTVNLTVN